MPVRGRIEGRSQTAETRHGDWKIHDAGANGQQSGGASLEKCVGNCGASDPSGGGPRRRLVTLGHDDAEIAAIRADSATSNDKLQRKRSLRIGNFSGRKVSFVRR